VGVISRDRDARYAEAITWEAPTATVVLDRWHVIRNLTDAVERAVARHHRSWTTVLRDHAEREEDGERRDADADVGDGPMGGGEPGWLATPAQEVPPREAERRRATRQRRQDRFDRIAELAGKGIGKMEIARRLNLDRGTVASYLQQGGPPTNEQRRSAPTLLDPFLPYLKTRFLDDGCRNAALLTREITALGYTGSVRTVMRRIRTWKRAAPRQLPSNASTCLNRPGSRGGSVLTRPASAGSAVEGTPSRSRWVSGVRVRRGAGCG
jgi:transposase